MPTGSSVSYSCDGTLPGVLCCIYESYVRRELPNEVVLAGIPSLLPPRHIPTNEAHARRVWVSLQGMGGEVANWILTGFLADQPARERMLFDFIRAAFDYKIRVTDRLDLPAVHAAFKAVRAVKNEAHLLCGFLRFTEHGGALAAVIEPKAMVLPLLRTHFCDRFSEETFLIYDKTHQAALLYQPHEAEIIESASFSLPPLDQREATFQALWKKYYASTTILPRINPRCRMNHMPKRFWRQMLEVCGELDAPARHGVLGDAALLPVCDSTQSHLYAAGTPGGEG